MSRMNSLIDTKVKYKRTKSIKMYIINTKRYHSVS